MNATLYKKYHESFMANNHGTTALHTFFCVFFTVLSSLLCSIVPMNTGLERYITEYIIIVLSMILVHTVFANYLYVLNFMVFSILIFELFKTHSVHSIFRAFSSHNKFAFIKIQSITCMRALTYLITVFCILAVDFQDFPRYLAKTEKYGYSLMDTGVGLFVLMSGLVHKDVSKESCMSIIKGNSKIFSVLVSLGLIRYFSVKQLDYQEHVTEYGVHWNFFFTLAVCKLISSIILYYSKRTLFLSLSILTLHEYLLYNSLQAWVFGDIPRVSLIEANREGIVSSLGYVSLYLFGVHIRSMLNDQSVFRYKILFRLILGSVGLWILTYFIDTYRPTSRRLANAGFCIYLETMLVTVLLVLYFFEVLYQDKECNLSFTVPFILSSIHENGLIYFIAANLLTGLINLTVRTLLTHSYVTFLILNMYMLATIAVSLYLKRKGIKI